MQTIRLYLDFDGVLHPDCAYRTGAGIELRREGASLFQWAPLLIEALAPYPGVQLVLATSWVQVLGYDRARGHLPELLRKRVAGATWHSSFDRAEWAAMSRYRQISRHVLRHETPRWLAIDDDADGWSAEAGHRLVRCDPDLGLAEPGKIDELIGRIEQWA
ncbi:HAD domain-containing protein [Denitromonas sp.]|uniref:HAD domain-containing protein n=1 Tax=Denitromonas sp. TaxID=2734609 RepID=UPI002AFFB4FD|nr:HAD domain-containing protein [Denitromonas sp.]